MRDRRGEQVRVLQQGEHAHPQPLTPIDGQHLAGDVRRAGADQEPHRISDLLRRAEPTQRNAPADPFDQRFREPEVLVRSPVRTGQGATAFTRMPYRAHSTASVRVNARTPALAEAEWAVPGPAIQA